jgi:hypothetical protein
MRVEQLSEDVTNVCEVCGDGFWVKPYRRKKARFCSQSCGGVWHAKTRLAMRDTSYMAGNQWRKGLAPANAFKPGLVAEDNPNWKPGQERKCEHCSAVFRQKDWVSRQNGAARFCSRSCFAASGCFVEDKSSTYVGGKATYRGRNWPLARAGVVEDQSGHCAHCLIYVGRSLPVHHITPFREFACEQEANARTNLIGLCQSCHMRAEPRPHRPRLDLGERVAKPVQEALL